MNPSHDNTQDAADLEIARLKAELEAAKSCHEAANREALSQQRQASKAFDQMHKAMAELSRLTEERDRLQAALTLVEFGSCDGCGSGRICFACSKDNPGANSSSEYWAQSYEHKRECPVRRALSSGDSE